MKQRHLKIGVTLAAAVICLQPLLATAKQGDWLMRGGVGYVDPKSDNLAINQTIAPIGLVQGEVEVDEGTSATLEGTYMFQDNWGIELLATTPFSHDVALRSGGTEVDVAKIKQILPTLSLQYHFNPEGQFRPYIGAGLNYTMIFDESAGGPLSGSDVNLDNSFGLAGQIGADFALSKNWFVNATARYIDMDAQGDVDGAKVGEVQIDPWVYQLQLGYRFRTEPAVVAAPVVAAAPPPPRRLRPHRRTATVTAWWMPATIARIPPRASASVRRAAPAT